MTRRALRLAALLLLGLGLLGLWVGRSPPQLAVPEPGAVLAHVTLVEPNQRREADRTVVVDGGRITRVAEGAPDDPVTAFAGAFVLPGLIDLHVHHPPRFAWGERELFALLFLAHGVTSVRDTGGFGDLLAHRRRLAAGERAGPRLFACGPFLDGAPPGWPGARVVHDEREARTAVEELVRAGADCAKVYNGVSSSALRGILRSARAADLPVVGHVPWGAAIAELPGVEVQHVMGLADETWVVRPERIDGYVEVSRRLGITHTPTLHVFERAARLGDMGSLREEPAARLLPRHYRDVLWDPARNPLLRGLVPGSFADLDRRLDVMREVVRRLHEAGVRVTAGTDTLNPFVVPGASLHAELRELVAAGLTPGEAWEAATRRAGEALGEPGLGTLAEGAAADLLIFREDPTRDLAALDTLEAVVAAGRLYPRGELEEAVVRQRRHFDDPLRAFLSSVATRAVLAFLRARSG